MALQIRRGLNTERLSLTPAAGELIFVTNYIETGVSPLWVGNGTTVGGLEIVAGEGGGGGGVGDALTSDDVKNIVGLLLQSGNNTGITYSYDVDTKTLSSTVNFPEIPEVDVETRVRDMFTTEESEHTNISFVYDANTQAISANVIYPPELDVKSIVDGMFTSNLNNHTNITFAYDAFNEVVNATVDIPTIPNIAGEVSNLFTTGSSNHEGISFVYDGSVINASVDFPTPPDVLSIVTGMFTTVNSNNTGIGFSYNNEFDTIDATVTFPSIEPVVGQMFTTAPSEGITFTYDAQAGTITAVVSQDLDLSTVRTTVNSMFTSVGNTHDGISFSFNSTNNTINATVDFPEEINPATVIGPLLEAGPHTNITFDYNSSTNAISATVTGISNLTLDTALTTDLNLNNNDLIGNGNIDITGTVTADTFIGTFQGELEGSNIIFVTDGSLGPVIDIETRANLFVNSGSISIKLVGGSELTPANPFLGDYIGGIEYKTDLPFNTNPDPVFGNDVLSGSIKFRVDPNGTINNQVSNGKMEIRTSGGTTVAGLITNYLTFDSKGRLAVNQETAQATVDINGVMRLVKQTNAPSPAVEGMIAVADRVNWDPANKGSGGSYPVYYNGTTWNALF
jgi:hypothetical protein